MNRVAATLVVLALAAVSAAAGEARDPLAVATEAAEKRQFLDAANEALAVARSAKESAERRRKGFALAAQAYVDLGCPWLALDTYAQALAALGEGDPFAASARLGMAEIHHSRQDYTEAVAILEKATGKLALAKTPPEQRAGLFGLLASCRQQMGRPRAAIAAYETLASMAEANDQLGKALSALALLCAGVHEFEKAQVCLARLSDMLDDARVMAEAARAYQEVAERLVAAGRWAEAYTVNRRTIALFAGREPSTAQAALRRVVGAVDEPAVLDVIGSLRDRELRALAAPDTLALLGPMALRLGRTDEFARACIRAVLAHPFDETLALSCLAALSDVRTSEGRHDDALAAAKACYGVIGFSGAYSPATCFAQAVDLVARALRARDGHLVSGNGFRSYQVHGPDGPDRKAGTPDDIPNLLAKVAYRADPETDGLFEAALQAQPTSAAGRRARGWMYIVWCKPQKALGELKQAFALCSLEAREFSQAAQDVALGLKALHATPAVMGAFAEFQRYGPEGPDGRKGTGDDLQDPLAGL